MSQARRVARTLREGGRTAARHVRRGDRRLGARVATCSIVNAGLLTVGSAVGRRRCPACGWAGLDFLWMTNEHGIDRSARCPGCGSSSRHRALAIMLPDLVERSAAVLHFAPEPQLRTTMGATVDPDRYRTTDRYRAGVDLPGLDIQALDLADDSYDVVVCNHVLEHVEDDRSAIGELARVVAPGGTAVITIPGDWDGSPTRSFGEVDANGHWRHYGNDVIDVLLASFGHVDRVTGDAVTADWRRTGIDPAEPIFVCRSDPA